MSSPKKKSLMSFVDVTPKFSLKDIGSKIIDQLSTDVYTGAGSILRELVKNAYDSYLALDPDDFDTGTFKRQVVISRERDDTGKGRIFIADQGIGQSVEDLKANVQISISRKADELDNATGFRGLGSWASLGAGSRIVISSSKKGDPHENRLIIDVRRVYQILSPKTTLDDILNNKTCISISQRDAEEDVHFTTVEIECDGKVEKVNGHEMNRLYEFTDPSDTELKRVLIQNCPIPFSKEGEAGKHIHAIYSQIGYVPTPIVCEGETLERRLPESLTDLKTETIMIGGQPAALAWRAHDPDDTGEITNLIEEEHNLGGPSIQLSKLNVPIGVKGLYSSKVVRDKILDWYVGEIHILAADVQPNASGDLLREGTARDAFVAEMKAYYIRLEDEAEKKSQRISLAKHLRNGQQAATKIASGGLSAMQEVQEMTKVSKAVEILQVLSKKGQPSSQKEQQIKEAAKHDDVVPVIKSARQVLKDSGLLEKLSSPTGTPGGATKKKPASASQPSTPKGGKNGSSKPSTPDTSESFQARVAQKLPKLNELGLSHVQVEGVLAIIQELFEGS